MISTYNSGIFSKVFGRIIKNFHSHLPDFWPFFELGVLKLQIFTKSVLQCRPRAGGKRSFQKNQGPFSMVANLPLRNPGEIGRFGVIIQSQPSPQRNLRNTNWFRETACFPTKDS